MGVSKYTFEEKKNIIVDFLKHNPDCSQGQIARELMFQLGYETEMAARVSIRKLLEQLQEMGICDYNEKKSERGFIPTKAWYLKDGIHNVSTTDSEA